MGLVFPKKGFIGGTKFNPQSQQFNENIERSKLCFATFTRVLEVLLVDAAA